MSDTMQGEFPRFRWRLAGGKLPLYERHLRSLTAYGVSAPLQAWIRSRLEWTIANMTHEYPDGVLCIQIDSDDKVTVMVEPSREAPGRHAGPKELKECGTTWTVTGDILVPCARPIGAVDTLVRDLAQTLGYTVLEEAPHGPVTCATCETTDKEMFLASDEFGIVVQGRTNGPVTQKMIECFDKLWKTED